MDACDQVMEKVDRPKGLIRYDSLSGIEQRNKKVLDTRVWAYSGVLLALIGLQIYLFSIRSDVEAVVLRTPGMLYQQVDDEYISNLYNYQLINKTSKDIVDIRFELRTPGGRIKTVGSTPAAIKQSMSEGAFFIEMQKDILQGRKNKIIIDVYAGDEKIDDVTTNFLGPPK